ncbi:DUF6349 family protein [Nonomuraea sp. NPDC052265]|uniref:DUF6349 family protein n=1 Tax=Nonomuraea sp. NPDC052265 TaxID=3364374 RepID=UPI0037CC6FA3
MIPASAGQPATGHPRPPGDDCRATIRSWRVEDGEPAPPTGARRRVARYRASCRACGDEGPIRSSEGAAVEDACDHAYPGWRTMPVVEPRPYKLGDRPRWEADCRRAYPPGWFDRQGPVREYRPSGGTRHVPAFAPGGGYCMAVMCTMPKPAPVRTVQTSLFG